MNPKLEKIATTFSITALVVSFGMGLALIWSNWYMMVTHKPKPGPEYKVTLETRYLSGHDYDIIQDSYGNIFDLWHNPRCSCWSNHVGIFPENPKL